MIHLLNRPSDKFSPMTLSVFLRKTFAGPKSRVSQAGQAVVEYILVLVVTVSIIMGVLYQFNDAFKNFLDNYFGDYIACLLETGELPGLGGEGPTSGECNAGFAEFSIASGRPKNGKGIGSSGDGSGAGSSKSGDSNSGSGSSDDSGSSGRSRPSRLTSNNAPRNSEARSGRSNPNRPGKQTGKQSSNQGSQSNSAGSDSTDGVGGRNRSRRRVIYLDDEYISEEAKRKRQKTVSSGKVSKKKRDMAKLRAAQFELEVPKVKRSPAEDEGGGFSFGFLFKMLLVAGILIMLFIFLGGQALSIKKSWQKSE